MTESSRRRKTIEKAVVASTQDAVVVGLDGSFEDDPIAAETPDSPGIVDPRDAAVTAGLVYVDDARPGFTRHRSGTGFFYRMTGDSTNKVDDPRILKRIRSLVIPPAWLEVWICRRADGHIQATGRDARGRKQYRYHPAFREIRESTKYEHMTMFAQMLPHIRGTVSQQMAVRGLPRETVLATIVYLLETTLIRVGNEDYAKQNKSYGLTTLRDKHVEVQGTQLLFQFKGKSGKEWKIKVRDRRAAKIIKSCGDLPGQQLFQYLDQDGKRQGIDSGDVNAYLRDITGQQITAKDFRTWAGTVLAALALSEFGTIDSQAKAKRNIRAAIESVAARLGNTATICRKCYIHPEILDCYMAGELLLEIKEEVEDELQKDLARLSPEETAVLALLDRRLGRELKTQADRLK